MTKSLKPVQFYQDVSWDENLPSAIKKEIYIVKNMMETHFLTFYKL